MKAAVCLVALLALVAYSLSSPVGGRGRGVKKDNSRPSSPRRTGDHNDDEVEILSETGPEVVEVGRSEVWEVGRVNRNRSPSPSMSVDSGPPPCCDNCPRGVDPRFPTAMSCECEEGSPCFSWNQEEPTAPLPRKYSDRKKQAKDKKSKKREKGDSIPKNPRFNRKDRRGGGGGGSLSVSRRRNPFLKKTRSH